ncbi:MAG: alcohol dehydrogenase catalytic domain-containing protein [Vampirovibrionales bacterium]|nr:alcohol dehydrogenase catalytic domain-containing protein [Vampirovibrionales bacterium]
MRALVVTQTPLSPQLDVVEQPMPACPEGGALVRLTACGLCGSDVDKFLNRTPEAGTVLGHEVVGVIKALSPTANTPLKVGDRIVAAHHVPCLACAFCLGGSESMCAQFKASNLMPGGWAEYFALTAGHLAHTVFKLPDAVTDAQAHSVEPLACVLKALEKCQQSLPRLARVEVIGLGYIGLLATQAFRQAGVPHVTGLDLNPARLAFAQQHALCPEVYSPQAPDLECLPPADVVFLTVVNAATLSLAQKRVRNGGVVLLFASPARAAQAQLDPYTLYFRELQVRSSYSPSLASLAHAAELIFTGQIQTGVLVSHQLPLTQAMAAVRLYQQGEALKVVFVP